MAHYEGFTEVEHYALEVVPKISGLLSLFGSFTYCYIYYLMSPSIKYKTYYHIIFMVSLIDIVTSTAYVLGYYPQSNSIFCSIQAWIITANIAVPLWTSFLTTHFYLTVLIRWPEWRARSLLWLYHVVVFCTSISLACVPLILNGYGVMGPWCWITIERNYLRLVCFYCPLWAMMIYNTVVVGMVMTRMKKRRADLHRELELVLGKHIAEGDYDDGNGDDINELQDDDIINYDDNKNVSRNRKKKKKKSKFWVFSLFSRKGKDEKKDIELCSSTPIPVVNSMNPKSGMKFIDYYSSDPDLDYSSLRPEDDVLAQQEGDALAVQFVAFVAAFLVTWLPGTANIIQNMIQPEVPIFHLTLAHALFVPLQGFFNMLVFVIPRLHFNKETWSISIDTLSGSQNKEERDLMVKTACSEDERNILNDNENSANNGNNNSNRDNSMDIPSSQLISFTFLGSIFSKSELKEKK